MKRIIDIIDSLFATIDNPTNDEDELRYIIKTKITWLPTATSVMRVTTD